MKNALSRLYMSMFALLAMATSALAVNADIDGLFTAVDVTTIKSNIITLLTAGVAIIVVFKGYAFVKKGVARF
jgi:hypothetical protein